MKYTTVKISGIITQIALKTEIEGYTEGIIEIFFPDDIDKWSGKKQSEWIKENNKRIFIFTSNGKKVGLSHKEIS